MRTLTTVAGILSWINLIIASFMTFLFLLGLLMTGLNPQALLVFLLMGAVILHSYAALQLRKAIVNPQLTLSPKTPTGIRFVGLLVLFFSVTLISSSILMLRNPGEFASQIKKFGGENMKGLEELDLVVFIRGVAGFMLFFGLSISLNALMNLTLLRMYRQQNDIH